MDDLRSIMQQIKEERPSNPIDKERVYSVIGPEAEQPQNMLQPPIKWDTTDLVRSINLSLSRYELYWLLWRLQVHLRSYENIKWPEMKAVIGDTKNRLEEEWQKSTITKAATGAGQ